MDKKIWFALSFLACFAIGMLIGYFASSCNEVKCAKECKKECDKLICIGNGSFTNTNINTADQGVTLTTINESSGSSISVVNEKDEGSSTSDTTITTTIKTN